MILLFKMNDNSKKFKEESQNNYNHLLSNFRIIKKKMKKIKMMMMMMIRKEEKEGPRMIILEELIFVICVEKPIYLTLLYTHILKPNTILLEVCLAEEEEDQRKTMEK